MRRVGISALEGDDLTSPPVSPSPLAERGSEKHRGKPKMKQGGRVGIDYTRRGGGQRR